MPLPPENARTSSADRSALTTAQGRTLPAMADAIPAALRAPPPAAPITDADRSDGRFIVPHLTDLGPGTRWGVWTAVDVAKFSSTPEAWPTSGNIPAHWALGGRKVANGIPRRFLFKFNSDLIGSLASDHQHLPRSRERKQLHDAANPVSPAGTRGRVARQAFDPGSVTDAMLQRMGEFLASCGLAPPSRTQLEQHLDEGTTALFHAAQVRAMQPVHNSASKATKLSLVTEAEAFFARVEARQTSAIDRNSGAAWVMFFIHKNMQAPHTTCSRTCPSRLANTACPRCPRQLSYGSIRNYVSKLRSSTNFTHAEAFDSVEWAVWFKQISVEQRQAGRTAQPALPIFAETARQLLTAIDESIVFEAALGDADSTVLLHQTALALCLDLALRRRTKHILSMDVRHMFISLDEHGRRVLHAEVVDTKSIFKNQEHYTSCQEREPDDPFVALCAVRRLQQYIEFLDTNGLTPDDFHLLFAAYDPGSRAMHAPVERGGQPATPCLTTARVNRQLQRLCASLNLDMWYTFHGTRVAAAMVQVSRADSLESINAAMGWAEASLMSERYARLLQIRDTIAARYSDTELEHLSRMPRLSLDAAFLPGI